MHQVRRLDHEILHAIGNCTVERLGHVVDLLAVTGLHVVDDDLSSERAADRPIRVGFLQSVLNALDILYATVVEGRTEADNEQLVFADFIFVARVVFCSVARIAAKVIRVSVIAFHKLLLCIGQRVPSFFCCFAFFIGMIIALLHIDCVDEIRNILRCHFVCFLLGCARRAAFDCGRSAALLRRCARRRVIAAACGSGREHCNCHYQCGSLFPCKLTHGLCFLSVANIGPYRIFAERKVQEIKAYLNFPSNTPYAHEKSRGPLCC